MKHRHLMIVPILFVASCGEGKSAEPAKAEQARTAVPDGSRLPASAPNAEGFVPAGWKLEQQAGGDISGDGVSDLVLILQGTDPAKVKSNENTGDETIDSNPRILAVALSEGAGYRLVSQNNRLIPVRDNPSMEDPIGQEPVIENGAASVRLDLFMSAGGASSGPYTFKFRYQDGAVRLIGYDRLTTHRMTGATERVSVNLLTGERTDATGNIETDKEQTKPSRVTLGPIPLDRVGDGFAFEIDQLK